GMDGYEECMTPTYFDHYFRHLYRIFKFVAESPLIVKEEDRYEYASMARGQLSRYELIWLYYNGLSSYGRDKFKPLIERFAILKNLRDEMLVQDLKFEISYDARAFLRTT
ncbi:MAG: putative phage abortive infection protein, partial [Muribaculum sp.]|nr:putative phage abortive infection protein [Muribaculum sp.]